ncbi:MAG: hypothetical protein J2P15_08755 [Micromonosporaceae bacterium]|nr:hypothetical protein [Micromonosporaceae bacterium]
MPPGTLRRAALAFAAVLALVAGCSKATAQGTGGATADSAAPASGVPVTGQPSAAAPSTPARPAARAAPAHFSTLPPGASLPSDAQCSAWVRARPVKENKNVNRRFNQTTGQHVSGSMLSGDGATAARIIAPRVDGQFAGTTGQILRWAACKWGIDEDVVKAQAAIESWWRQTTQGDLGTDPTACPPGHPLGSGATAGKCAQSYGILQTRYPFMKQAWPAAERSTAMNADVAYAFWRSCFEGYETWLNTVERGRTYAKGDLWGCVGRWFSGRWHTADSESYIARVRDYLRQRIWEQPDFQEA